MSGIADKDPKKVVFVIGTTNKPEHVDWAMVQSGRLSLEIRVKYPNIQERKLFIEKRLDKFAIDPKAFDIDTDKLARETHGKSFEDLKLMMDRAFIHVGIKGSVISQEILEQAIDSELRKIIDMDSKDISADEQRILAAHYAGQTLAHILLNPDEKITKVTTRQVVVKVQEESMFMQYENAKQQKTTGLEQGEIFTYLEHDTLDIKNQSLSEITKKAKSLLAGRIAERLITNTCSTFFASKKNLAFNMIKSIVADGVDLKSLSKSGQNKISDETQIRLKEFEAEVEQLLSHHKDALVALTNALEKEKTLSISQIMAIIDTAQGKNSSPLKDEQSPAMAIA
jgi:ATP-dependent Zn protease